MTFSVIINLGMVLFIAMITTAVLGMLVSKGKIPYNWHPTMARVTIVILIIHGLIAMAYYLGL